MREILRLASVELGGFFGFSIYRHTRDKKEKKRIRMLFVAWALIFALAFFYIGGLVLGLCYMGLGELVLSYLALIASLLTVIFSLFSAGGHLFSRRGYDILAALPVRQSSIVAARLSCMYVSDMLFTLVVMVPGILVYTVLMQPSLWFVLGVCALTLCIPCIPLVICSVLGTLIYMVSSRLKHKNIIRSAIMFIFALGMVLLSFFSGQMGELTPEMLADIANTVGGAIRHIYPPALWFGETMKGDLLAAAAYIGVSLGSVAILLLVVSRCFETITARLISTSAKRSYRVTSLTAAGTLRALCVREARRYIVSTAYLTNTAIGPILCAILSGAFLAFGGVSLLPPELADARTLAAVAPFVLAAVATMMPTTSVSVSMEGKHIGLLKALPITMKQFLDAKIVFFLLLVAPFYLIASVLCAIALSLSVPDILWLLLAFGAQILLSAVVGVAVDLKLHSFTWTREEAVVKQSASAFFGGFFGFLASAVFAVLLWLTPAAYTRLAELSLLLILLGLTALIYRRCVRADMTSL